MGQGEGKDNSISSYFHSVQEIVAMVRKDERKIQIINRFAGHDEVCAEEGRQDGGKFPGDECNKLGDGTIQALASFYKDDIYRSHLLEQGIKLLEMLITGRFSHTVP